MLEKTPQTIPHTMPNRIIRLLPWTVGIAVLCSPISSVLGQEDLSHQALFPGGISVESGGGTYRLQDEFLTGDRFFGPMPYFAVSLSRFRDHHGFRLGMKVLSSHDISSRYVTADVSQISLRRDDIYPIGRVSILDRDLAMYAGPFTEIFIYNASPQMARFELVPRDISFAVLFSIGAHSEIIVSLQQSLRMEASAHLSLMSIGLRSYDFFDNQASMFGLYGPLSGLNVTAAIGLRYQVTRRLSARLADHLQLTRIRERGPRISIANNLIGGLTFHF